MSALDRILSGDKPCFGVLKSSEDLSRAAAKLNAPNLTGLHKALESRILSVGEIIPLTEHTRASICAYLAERAALALA